MATDSASRPGLVKATVAPGRTLTVNGVAHPPGAEVSIDRTEVDELTLHGFIGDPEAAAMTRSRTGPRVEGANGRSPTTSLPSPERP